ncbi:efflux RND transporter periplasmic adaptor subunit [Legionella qingyii]|uniref:Efflux RND transporter periplasmic adaptor subunit n=1 Tax=Legionella qingyii TaxID=2184757 RepID=A0A317U668_9GAMM|nr:efflux RND transporter periplasmic adaptor subunit [Legionella qingyii]PWY56949.1 efflux RND transporter periplasmic adaptor subunit [Legionella qingyii]RUR24411.1 efflux RND transporter periplasmic adaptor subunit [Legionella qingyii]RUR27060.1 efflux RND transporter periplasmic adaptor subunit [Legionella qingyii]
MKPRLIFAQKSILGSKFKFIALSSILLTALGIYFKFYYQAAKSSAPSPKIVETVTIRPSTIEKKIKLIGTIRPKHATVLIAKGSGMLDILMSSGQIVQKGDLIAKIINPDIERSYQLSKETEQLEKTQYQRVKNLQKTGFVSAREVEEKKRIWIDSQKEKARTKIELKNMRFYAPFDGVIGAFKIKEGAQVTEGAPVVTIYDPNSLTVEIDIPCTNNHSIEENQPIYILGKLYHLNHVQKMIDDETHMCPADVDIQCTHCLVGASVSSQLVVNKKTKALVIPAQALFLKQGKTHVYKVVDKKIELIAVKTGIQEQDKVEIISGLKSGDQIVSKSPERLYPGLEISIYKG